ncbi:MAG: photosystem II reaction center protein Ycf12 [Gloeomargaritaceae cyanobacterium C42_A2020_066]|nr:photosystem II reaction center protein Ycf12 [Gloeomargaritaceae cyanobacterium C42_A2020_066]
MDFLTNFVGSVNWEVLAQLVLIGMVVLAGPVVIFLLAARQGNL